MSDTAGPRARLPCNEGTDEVDTVRRNAVRARTVW